MTNRAKTYLNRIKAAASHYDLQGVEIDFKRDRALAWAEMDRLCRAAEEKRYTLNNSEETIRLKNILFTRVGAEMDAYHSMGRDTDGYTPEEIQRQRERFCSLWQVLEEAELTDEYDAWKYANGKA